MIKEVSCGAIIFRKDNGKILYLLLEYPSYWGFPKGLKEQNESELSTVRREVAEETGIKDLNFLLGYKKTNRYFYWREGKKVFKLVHFFLAETKDKEVSLSWEHKSYAWLPFEEAFERLTFKQDKENLKEANELILKQLKKLN